MGSKIALIAGLGLGYVMGTRAGRQRYEQIKSGFKHVRDTPVVSRSLDNFSTKLSDAVRAGGERVTDKVADAVKERLFGTSGTSGTSRPSTRTPSAEYVDITVEEVPTHTTPTDPAGSASTTSTPR